MIAEGARKIAALPDPVGEVIEGFRLANGLDVRKVRVPLGVVAVILGQTAQMFTTMRPPQQRFRQRTEERLEF